MNFDPFEIAMKSATFLGVVLAAVTMIVLRGHDATFRRALVVGIIGVALMIGNAWLSAWGILVDIAYLAFAARMMWKALARNESEATFTIVAASQSGNP